MPEGLLKLGHRSVQVRRFLSGKATVQRHLLSSKELGVGVVLLTYQPAASSVPASCAEDLRLHEMSVVLLEESRARLYAWKQFWLKRKRERLPAHD